MKDDVEEVVGAMATIRFEAKKTPGFREAPQDGHRRSLARSASDARNP
jgi:hypothetical protein